MRNLLIIRIVACCALAEARPGAFAATLTECVHNVGELKTYLNAASSATNADNYVLLLRDGVYLAPSGGFTFYQNTNHSLDIEGGFFGLNGGTGCDLRILSAAGTVLDGRGNQAILTIISNQATSGNITLRYLTFQHAGGDVDALDVQMASNTGSLRVENSLFTGNATTYHTVWLRDGAAKTYFIDNAVVGNIYGAHLSQSVVRIESKASPNTKAYINNNTIAGNSDTDGPGQYDGLTLFGPAGFSVANNIVWDDLHFCEVNAYSDTGSPPPAVTFDKNDIDSYCSGLAPQAGSGNIDKDPLFADPVNGDYRLLPNSPAVEAGDNSPPGGTRSTDLDGYPRIVGTIDMGAYEVVDHIFGDGFDF